jgi:CDP-diacylglycerol--serine O-phosphatidyltransferase
MAFKFKGYAWGPNRYKYLLLLLSVVAIILLKWLAAPFILGAYILLSFLHAAKS